MKLWKGFLVVGVVALASCAFAQENTVIGVYWDTAATQTVAVHNGGYDVTHTAYIFVVDAEQVVGGAAFMVEKDSRLVQTGATYPAGLQIGALDTGIQIGLTNPGIGYFGTPVLLATVQYWTGVQIIEDAQISIVAYPPEGVIQLSDQWGMLRAVDGGTAYLSVPVEGDETSWGDVKAMYN